MGPEKLPPHPKAIPCPGN